MSRNRQKLSDLSSKFGIQNKPPRVARPKAEAPVNKQEPSFRSFSKLTAPKPEKHDPDYDDDLESLSGSMEPIPDLIPSDNHLAGTTVSKPRLQSDEFDEYDESSSPDNIVDLDDSASVTSIKPRRKEPVEEDTGRRSKSERHDEDFGEEEPSGLLAVPRPRQARPASAGGRNTRRAPEEQPPQEAISRQSIIRLIRSSELQSAGSDLVDAVKELLAEFTKTVLAAVADPQKIITTANLHRYMASFIENEDRDLVQDVVIDPNHFKRFIRPICEEHKYVVKNDVFYLLHLFVETVIVKILQGSDMVADAAKRQRVGPKDLLVAYSIYMM